MWKVQFQGVNGWFDMRESVESQEEYRVCVFEKKIDAETEAIAMAGIFEEESRVVSSDTPEDWSPYC